MKRYSVTIPITGSVTVEVEAESEEAAVDAAFDRDEPWPELDQWELHRVVCKGNVYSGVMNEAEAQEIDADGNPVGRRRMVR